MHTDLFGRPVPPPRPTPPAKGKRRPAKAALKPRAAKPNPLERAPAIAARNEAMTQVATKAEDLTPNFHAEARAFVLRYLREHGPTAGEVLSMQCKAAGITPHDDRAFGPVYYGLYRARLIVKVGTVKRMRGHATAGGNVWSLR